MNEVRTTQVANAFAASTASSTGSVQSKPPQSGKDLPPSKTEQVSEVDQKPKTEGVLKTQLEIAVVNVNDYMQSLQRDLQFSVDEELDQTVIKVVDSDSGELIRQIPDDIFLELARRLKDDGELRLLNALG